MDTTFFIVSTFRWYVEISGLECSSQWLVIAASSFARLIEWSSKLWFLVVTRFLTSHVIRIMTFKIWLLRSTITRKMHSCTLKVIRTSILNLRRHFTLKLIWFYNVDVGTLIRLWLKILIYFRSSYLYTVLHHHSAVWVRATSSLFVLAAHFLSHDNRWFH